MEESSTAATTTRLSGPRILRATAARISSKACPLSTARLIRAQQQAQELSSSSSLLRRARATEPADRSSRTDWMYSISGRLATTTPTTMSKSTLTRSRGQLQAVACELAQKTSPPKGHQSGALFKSIQMNISKPLQWFEQISWSSLWAVRDNICTLHRIHSTGVLPLFLLLLLLVHAEEDLSSASRLQTNCPLSRAIDRPP